MRKVIKIDMVGLFVEDVLVEDGAETPESCIETPCPDGLYWPKWDGSKWVEGKTQSEIEEIKANEPTNIRTEAVTEMESATTIAGLRAAMIKFVNASS